MVVKHSEGKTRVVIAGVTGWAGGALARGILGAGDLALVAGVSRTHAGERVGDALGAHDAEHPSAAPVVATAAEALAVGADVFVEYTKPDVARAHVLEAIDAGVHVVIGTSGLTDEDLAAIDRAARSRGVGVLACGNFSLTAVLMMKFSAMAAEWLESWEVIDYASASKIDAPSGTARELAARLGAVKEPRVAVSPDEVRGEREARGATLSGTQVHSVRLPGFVLGVESVFGQEGETLRIRHDAGASAEPYVAGALLAVRRVADLVGLHRGLDAVMEAPERE